MAFSISRKVLIRYVACGNSCSKVCLLTVRRNASSSLPDDEPLSPEPSTTPVLGLSKKEYVRQKKTAAVAALLKDYGFTTDAHISKLESRIPHIYKYSPEKNLSPKLKFLESIGLSSTDIPKLVLRNSYLLTASLEKKLIPCYNYLKNLSVSEEQLSLLLKSYPHMLTGNWEATIAPNVELLRGMGVPLSIITYCVTTHRLPALRCSHAQFKSSVDQAIEIGLNPLRKTFIIAIQALCGNSKKTWARKMDVYRGFGFSDDEILLVFRKYPKAMYISEKKIARGLEYFFKELSWTPATIISYPAVLQYSLERRVIPRCEVVEILKKKGLLNVSISPNFLKMSEEKFLNGYIRKYKDDSSELMDIYKRYNSSTQKKTL